MKISNVEINTYKIPLPEPVEAYAAGVMKAFDLVICKIDNDNGQQGIGYITVHENQGLAIASIIKNSFVPLLLDKDPRLIELLWKIIYSDGIADHYETNLIRRVCGLLYISEKDNGDIKLKVSKELN